jgi:hypothetical protein
MGLAAINRPEQGLDLGPRECSRQSFKPIDPRGVDLGMKWAGKFTLGVLEAKKPPQVPDHMLEAESIADFCLRAHKGLYPLGRQVAEYGYGSLITNEL